MGQIPAGVNYPGHRSVQMVAAANSGAEGSIQSLCGCVHVARAVSGLAQLERTVLQCLVL